MAREKLIAFRGDRTQAEMAKIYGVTQQAWDKWEQGKTLPTASRMLRLEQASGIPMEELFADKFNEAKLS